jgi:hypothetical protein
VPGGANHEQLLLEQQLLSDDALDTARTEQLRNSSQQINQKQPDVFYYIGRLAELLSTARLL